MALVAPSVAGVTTVALLVTPAPQPLVAPKKLLATDDDVANVEADNAGWMAAAF